MASRDINRFHSLYFSLFTSLSMGNQCYLSLHLWSICWLVPNFLNPNLGSSFLWSFSSVTTCPPIFWLLNLTTIISSPVLRFLVSLCFSSGHLSQFQERPMSDMRYSSLHFYLELLCYIFVDFLKSVFPVLYLCYSVVSLFPCANFRSFILFLFKSTFLFLSFQFLGF